MRDFAATNVRGSAIFGARLDGFRFASGCLVAPAVCVVTLSTAYSSGFTMECSMKNGFRIIAAAVLLSGTLAGRPAEAQLAYTAVVRTVQCEPGETAPCSRGVIDTVDTATRQTIRSIEVWRNRRGLIEIAVHPAGDRLYVMTCPPPGSTSQETSFQVFNTSTWIEETAFTISGVGAQLAFSPRGARLFVARTELSDVAVIDTGTHQVVDGIPAHRPFDVLVGRDGRVYVAHADKRITVHDGSSYGLLREITIPSTVFRMTFSTGGSHLYGGAGDDGVVDVDLTSGGVTVISDVGSTQVRDVAYARGKLYVAATHHLPVGIGEIVSVIDPVTHAIVGRISLPDPVHVIASPDESRLLATTSFDGWTAIDTTADTRSRMVPGPVISAAFAAPTPHKAIFIDAPPAGASLRQPFSMSGWAVDVRGLGLEPGIDTIHVWAHPVGGGTPRFVGVPSYGSSRPDVARLFGPRYLNAGYTLTVAGLPAGHYDLVAYGRSAWTHEFVTATSRRVRVLPPELRVFVDTPTAGATVFPSTAIAGWALDPASTSGSGLELIAVWAHPTTGGAPIFAGVATMHVRRPDVAAVFGPQFIEAGWVLPGERSNLPPGQYTLVVHAWHTGAGAFLAQGQTTVTVRAPVPIVTVDVPAAGLSVSSPVRVAGWAIDYGVTAGTGVDGIHVWATPVGGGASIFLGAADYGRRRADVAAAFGERYGFSAFELNASLPAGTYTLLVFPHVVRLGTFGPARAVTVTVR